MQKKLKKLVKIKQCSDCSEYCCYFTPREKNLSPFFTKEEVEKIKRTKISVNWRRIGDSYRVRLVDAKDKKKLICPFFNEENYHCLIEKIKPLDCLLWPFVFMKNENGSAVNLVYYDSNYCSALKHISERKFNDYKKYLIRFCESLDKGKILNISWDFDADTIIVAEILKL